MVLRGTEYSGDTASHFYELDHYEYPATTIRLLNFKTIKVGTSFIRKRNQVYYFVQKNRKKSAQFVEIFLFFLNILDGTCFYYTL